jgi:hypothetical protein
MKRKKSFALSGGSASRPPGFIAVGPEWLPGCGAVHHRPGHSGPWSMLELLPSRALSPAQVIVVYQPDGTGHFTC